MMKSILIMTVLLALALILVSCPEPLTEDVVVAAEDSLIPSIDVLSPSANGSYYSNVNFSLKVLDDALSQGDGKGDVASIEFAVSNDDFRGGKINIDGGTVTKVASAGPDTISYDPSSGMTSFSFSTISPNTLRGYLSVSVKATDRNGNIKEEKISLSESAGPWTEYTVKDSTSASANVNKYLPGKDVYLEGKLGNSLIDKDKDDEIKSIRWNIAGVIQGELVLDKEAEYTIPPGYANEGTNVKYYNSAENRYERKVVTPAGEDLAKLFTYDPATRIFKADNIYMIDSFSGTVLMNLVVTDMNGHETNSNVFLAENSLGPAIIPKRLNDEGYYGYFSTAAGGLADRVTGKLDATSTQLSYFRYSLTYDGVTTPTYNLGDAGSGISINDATKDFSIDFKPKLTALGAKYTQLSNTDNAEVKIKIEAAFDADRTSTVTKNLRHDKTPPSLNTATQLLIKHGATAGTVQADYANDSDSLDLSFTVTEDEPRITDTEVSAALTIADHTATVNGVGALSHTAAGSSWRRDAGFPVSDQYIPVKIVLADRLNNTRTYYSSGHPDAGGSTDILGDNITYYDGSKAFASFLLNDSDVTKRTRLTANSDGTANTEDVWAGKNESVLLEIFSSREIESVTSPQIYGVNASATNGSSGADLYYNAAYGGALVTENTPMTASFTLVDRAGNSYAVTGIGGVSLDTKAPDLSSLSYVMAGEGAKNPNFINSLSSGSANNEVLRLTNLGSTDANYFNIDFKMNGGSYGARSTTADIPVHSLTGLADASYNVDVRVYDYGGNSASKTIPVIVDKTGPSFTVNQFYRSSRPSDGNRNYARGSDTVDLRFSVSDTAGIDASGYSFSFYDSTPKSEDRDGNTSDDNWEFRQTLTADTHDNAEIPLSLTARDNAGNSATHTTADFSSADKAKADVEASVKYYKSALSGHITLEYLTANNSNDNGNELYAASGEEFSLRLTTARDLESFDYSFYGVANNGVALNAGQNHSFSKTRSDGGVEEPITFDFTGAAALKDKAGNSYEVSSISGKSLFYDSKAPVVASLTSVMDGDGGYNPNYINSLSSRTNDDEVLRLTNLSSIDGHYKNFRYKINGGTYQGPTTDADIPVHTLASLTDNSYNVEVEVYDYAGNSADRTFPVVVDKTLPAFTVDQFNRTSRPSDGNKNYARGSDTIDLRFSVSDASGIDASAYSFTFYDSTPKSEDLDGNTSDDNWEFRQTLTADTHDNAEIPLSLTARDNAGNSATHTTADFSSADKAKADVEASVKYYKSALSGHITLEYLTENTGNDNGSDLYAASGEEFSLRLTTARDLESFDYNFYGEDNNGVALNAGQNHSFSKTRSDADVEEQIAFDFTGAAALKDKAGNSYEVSSISGKRLFYDSKKPVVANLTYVMAGDGGFNPNYINSLSSSGADNEVLRLTNLSAIDGHYKDLRSNVNGGGYGSRAASADVSVHALTTLADNSYNVQVEVYDYAGNYDDRTFSVIVDRTRPGITASGNGPDTELEIVFTDAYAPLGAGNFTLSNLNGDLIGNSEVLSAPATITYTSTGGSFTDSYKYRLTVSPAFKDAAGNSSYSNYDITYGTWAVTQSGIAPSATQLTLKAETAGPTGGGGSNYSGVRVYESPEPYTAAPASVEVEDQNSGKSFENDRKEIISLKSSSLRSVSPVRSQSAGAAARAETPTVSIERPEGRDSGSEELRRAMALVEERGREYRANLDSLIPEELSRAEMLELNAALEPEIYRPETITVSASPLVSGSVGQIEVVLSEEGADENEGAAAADLVLKALILLLGAAATAGFLMLMKRMQR